MTGAAPQLLTLLLGVGGLLVVASLVGRGSRLSPPGRRAERGDRQPQRPHRGVVGDGDRSSAIAFLAGRTGVVLLFALCSFAALREFMTLTRTARADHWALSRRFFVVLPVQYWLVWTDWYGLYSIFIPVYVFLFLPILAALRGEHEGLPRPRGRDAMGADDLRLLRQPRAGAPLPPDPGVRGARCAADRLPGRRRADVRRAPVRLGQADRAAEDRAAAVAVEDLGGVPGRRRLRHRAGRGALVDDALHALAGGWPGCSSWRSWASSAGS